MTRSAVLATVLAVSLDACATAQPRLRLPDRMQTFCPDRAALLTAIESVIASAGEVTDDPMPSHAQLRAMVQKNTGIIGHYNDQLLEEPALAKVVGSPTTFVTLGDVWIVNNIATGTTRPLYLTVKTPSGPRSFVVRAGDVQDVCNAGALKS